MGSGSSDVDPSSDVEENTPAVAASADADGLGLVRSQRPFGRNRQLWGRGRWPRGCQVGPDWPCLVLTFVLLWAPPVAVLVIFAADAQPLAMGVQAVSLFLVSVALSATAFSDPGILPKYERSVGAQPLPATDPVTGRTLCTQCLVYRPRGAFHCRDCNACVEELDHHCPWTGRCIGKHNLLQFKIYLGTLVGHIVVFIVVTIVLATARAAADMKRMGVNNG